MRSSRRAITAGQRWGRWTVQAPHSGGKHPRWISCCICGTERPVREDDLLDGSSRSCGCFAREMAAFRARSAARADGRLTRGE
jgi:hypothetical protein